MVTIHLENSEEAFYVGNNLFFKDSLVIVIKNFCFLGEIFFNILFVSNLLYLFLYL